MVIEWIQQPCLHYGAAISRLKPAAASSRGGRGFGTGQQIARRFGIASACALVLAGCAVPRTPYPLSFNSFRADERIMAARYAAETRDRQAIPLLVDRLEDEDSAVRLFTILSLEKLTGTRLGYEYHADEVDRARAVRRWRRYLEDTAASQPESVSVGPRSAGGGE